VFIQRLNIEQSRLSHGLEFKIEGLLYFLSLDHVRSSCQALSLALFGSPKVIENALIFFVCFLSTWLNWLRYKSIWIVAKEKVHFL